MDEQPQPQHREPNYPRRFITLAVVLGIWAAIGVGNDWDGTDWLVFGVAGGVAAILCLLVENGWTVATSTFVVLLIASVAVAAVEDIGGGDKKKKGGTTTVTETTATVPEFQRDAVEAAVRDWFDATRKGDGTALCLVEAPELSDGDCKDREPRRGLPAGDELRFVSVDPEPGGGAFTARVEGGSVSATVHVTGVGFNTRVARVEGIE